MNEFGARELARRSAGMPLGVQLAGLPGEEARTLAVAAQAERALT